MYYVNKIVGWCLSPLGVGFALFALSLVAHRPACRFRTLKFASVLAFVWLWVFACGFLTCWIGLPLEGEEVELASLPKADVIVLLGGGMNFHEKCGRPEICSGADRAWTAAKLFTTGLAPLMTVSGKAAPAEIAFLQDLGVDTNRIVRLDAARNTEEEASLVATAVRATQGGGQGPARRISILLVTSAWHMPRAKMMFERAGFEVVAAPADYEAHAASESPLKVGDFFPNADALNRNSYLAKEWIARFCYRFKK